MELGTLDLSNQGAAVVGLPLSLPTSSSSIVAIGNWNGYKPIEHVVRRVWRGAASDRQRTRETIRRISDSRRAIANTTDAASDVSMHREIEGGKALGISPTRWLAQAGALDVFVVLSNKTRQHRDWKQRGGWQKLNANRIVNILPCCSCSWIGEKTETPGKFLDWRL